MEICYYSIININWGCLVNSGTRLGLVLPTFLLLGELWNWGYWNWGLRFQCPPGGRPQVLGILQLDAICLELFEIGLKSIAIAYRCVNRAIKIPLRGRFPTMGIHTETISTDNVWEHLVVGFFFFFFAGELANGLIITTGGHFANLEASCFSSGKITLSGRKIPFVVTQSDERFDLFEFFEVFLLSWWEGLIGGLQQHALRALLRLSKSRQLEIQRHAPEHWRITGTKFSKLRRVKNQTIPASNTLDA